MDVVQALIARGQIEKAMRYQLEVPLLLGVPLTEAMMKTVDEITEYMDSIMPRPLPGYTNFWWGPEA